MAQVLCRAALIFMTIHAIVADQSGFIKDVNMKFQALEEQVLDQNAKMSDLVTTINAQQAAISELTEKLDAQARDRGNIIQYIGSINTIIESHGQMIADLIMLTEKELRFTEEHTKFTEEHTKLNEEATKLNEDDTKLKQNDDQWKDDPLDKQLLHMRPQRKLDEMKRFVIGKFDTVAFQATIAKPDYNKVLRLEDNVVFETVSLNVGGAYDSVTGRFLAPLPGIYIFSASIATHMSSERVQIDIEKNGDEIAGAYADHESLYDQSSVTIAVQLNVGDEIVVKIERHDNITIFGGKLSSFMGCLIFSM